MNRGYHKGNDFGILFVSLGVFVLFCLFSENSTCSYGLVVGPSVLAVGNRKILKENIVKTEDLSFLSLCEKQSGTSRRNTDFVADKDLSLVPSLTFGGSSYWNLFKPLFPEPLKWRYLIPL